MIMQIIYMKFLVPLNMSKAGIFDRNIEGQEGYEKWYGKSNKSIEIGWAFANSKRMNYNNYCSCSTVSRDIPYLGEQKQS